MKNEIAEIKRAIVPILKKNGVVKAGIFGSYARGEATKKSDIDVLIQFKGRKSLLDLVGVKLDIEDKLKRKADVVEYSALHPLLRKSILKEEVRIYEAGC
jgi:uncharacterized protein